MDCLIKEVKTCMENSYNWKELKSYHSPMTFTELKDRSIHFYLFFITLICLYERSFSNRLDVGAFLLIPGVAMVTS